MDLTPENFVKLLAESLKNPEVVKNLQAALSPIVSVLVESEVQKAVEGFQLEIETIKKKQEEDRLCLEAKIKCLEEEKERALQYSFKEDLLIEGLPIPQRAPNSDSGQGAEASDITKTFVDFCNRDLGVQVLDRDISAIHPLPQKTRMGGGMQGNRAKVIVRFANRRVKSSVYKARLRLNDPEKRRKFAGSPVFINEHLTPKTSKLFHEARQMKARKEVQNCWTYDCKVFVSKNSVVKQLT